MLDISTSAKKIQISSTASGVKNWKDLLNIIYLNYKQTHAYT